MNPVAEGNTKRQALGSIAQLGEHMPYKHGVTGSSPVVPTNHLARWCSRLARQPVTLEVDGSSPFRVAIFNILRIRVECRFRSICLRSSVGRAAD